MIKVDCPKCHKAVFAPPKAAGKTGKCPGCGEAIQVPRIVEADDDDEYRLAPDPVKTPAPMAVPVARSVPFSPPAQAPSQPLPAAKLGEAPTPRTGAWVPTTKSSTPDWLRHLHWLLALAMLPLAISILLPDETSEQLQRRIADSLLESRALSANESEAADPSEPQAAPAGNSQEGPPATPVESPPSDGETDQVEAPPGVSMRALVDAICEILPSHKLKGALLARGSPLPWLFALVTIVAYMVFFTFLAFDNSAKPLHILGVGAFTATAGIALLFGVQLLAGLAGSGRIRVRGIAGLFLLVFLLIGLSYRMALDPDSNLLVSFLGFTLGVGLCEEICKAIPMLMAHKLGIEQNWRGAFIWGLASGAGFGVAEGILYSYDMYNGISGAEAYLVRFISCVALHAVWAGSVGITIQQNSHWLQEDFEEEGWWMYLLVVLRMIAVPMVLHGLYDTLLKKEMPLLALVTAIASFGWLAYVIYRLRSEDDLNERAAYVAKFIRNRGAPT